MAKYGAKSGANVRQNVRQNPGQNPGVKSGVFPRLIFFGFSRNFMISGQNFGLIFSAMVNFTEKLGTFSLPARPAHAPSQPKSQIQKILYAPVGGKKVSFVFPPKKIFWSVSVRHSAGEGLTFEILKILKNF